MRVVYQIRNTKTNKIYIGGTNNYRERINRHLYNLRSNRHPNIHLQRSFNKNGEESFVFEIMEKIPEDEDVFEREQQYLDEYDKRVLYNLSNNASGGDLVSYHPNNKEIRKKISRASSLLWEKMSEEERERRRRNMTGKNNPNYGNRWSPELRDRVSKIVKKRYKDNPHYAEQATKRIKNYWKNITEEQYKKFCEMRREASLGENNPFYGKSHSEETREHLSQLGKERWETATEEERFLLNPKMRRIFIEGKIYNGHIEAAAELDVVPGTIVHRVRSQNPLYENYYYVDENGNKIEVEMKPRKDKSEYANRTKWIITSPEGNEFISYSLTEFCKEMNFSYATFYKWSKLEGAIMGGKSKGWKIRKG